MVQVSVAGGTRQESPRPENPCIVSAVYKATVMREDFYPGPWPLPTVIISLLLTFSPPSKSGSTSLCRRQQFAVHGDISKDCNERE